MFINKILYNCFKEFSVTIKIYFKANKSLKIGRKPQTKKIFYLKKREEKKKKEILIQFFITFFCFWLPHRQRLRDDINDDDCHDHHRHNDCDDALKCGKRWKKKTFNNKNLSNKIVLPQKKKVPRWVIFDVKQSLH